jgi:hypothetical protein
MNTTHTPEPWGFDKNDEDNLFVFSKAKICNLYNTIGTEYDEAEANAARIVACVNACAGMEDPAAEIERLKAQRAELVMGKADIAIQGADAAIQGSDATIQRNTLFRAIKSHVDLYNAGLLTDPQQLEEHTLKLAEIYTNIINA